MCPGDSSVIEEIAYLKVVSWLPIHYIYWADGVNGQELRDRAYRKEREIAGVMLFGSTSTSIIDHTRAHEYAEEPLKPVGEERVDQLKGKGSEYGVDASLRTKQSKLSVISELTMVIQNFYCQKLCFYIYSSL